MDTKHAIVIVADWLDCRPFDASRLKKWLYAHGRAATTGGGDHPTREVTRPITLDGQ